MKFKACFTVSGFRSTIIKELSFKFPIPSNLEFVLKKASEDEIKKYDLQENFFLVEAFFIKNPNEKNLKILEQICEGLIPREIKNDWVKKNKKYGIGHCPDYFQDFIKNTSSEVTSYISKTIRYLCWRYNLPLQSNVVFMNELSCGDIKNWSVIPTSEYYVGDFWHEDEKTQIDCAGIVDEIVNERNEPLAHELLREANSIKFTSPKSALVIGVAALETGVKTLIQNINPESSWLIENIQSPPVLAILQNYIPTLRVKYKVQGQVRFAPEDKTFEQLKKCLSIRNNIVHGRKQEVDKHDLFDYLRTIKNVLYWLDFYAGNKWAINNTSGEIFLELRKNK